MLSLIVLFIAIAASLTQRVRLKRRTTASEFPEHAKPSPLSEALQELIGMAGGIYLSLLLLITFLQLELPDKLDLYGLEISPLAFAALVLAIIQPFIIKIIEYFKKGGR
ncbi:MAG: hypothetical protein KGZ79_08280 [Dethiobacter sp.]|jgi:hypothetical protein|nr:hypothetical protein [Dethiobacter sp.]